MIPRLTIDEESVYKNWEGKKDSIEWVKKHCDVVFATNSDIPLYECDNNWVNMGVFKEYKKVYPLSECHIYGYCDTEESLIKYLQQYVDDKENNYFVNIGGMSMDYEKYYKFGSYINKDGEDTGMDYYNYIDENPDMKVEQDVKGRWIRFCIYRLKK
jgi:hypothetical protein